MIELCANESDIEYDSCGNTAIAILRISGGVSIPLCSECVEELKSTVKMFSETIFCYRCKHFLKSRSGFRYGGSCRKRAERDGFSLTEECAGYQYCVSSMNTCKEGE